MERDLAPSKPVNLTGTRASHPAWAVALLAALVSACTPQAHVVGGGAGPVLGTTIKLAPGTVKADLTVVGDASQILKESAVDSLEVEGMTCIGSSGPCPTIDLYARLVAPAPAFTGATPTIRIVELVAGYRAAGSSTASSTVAYQRTIAVPGNLSTATWMRVSDALMTDLAGDFAFRSVHSGIVIRLPSWASWQTTLSRASSPRAFHVAITGDGRADDDTIGNVGGREVRLARRATDYIAEMLTDELRGSGHTIVPAKDGRLVGSQLEKFWITSTKRQGGWDTNAEIEIFFEVGPPAGIKRKKGERHGCSASEHSVSPPSEPDLARVLQRCLADLAVEIRGDSAWWLGEPGAATASPKP